MTIRRRAFSALLPAALWSAFAKNSFAQEIFISDTHSHSNMTRQYFDRCFECELTASKVSLVSWAAVADGPFIARNANGGIQVNFKPSPKEYQDTFLRQIFNMQSRIHKENLKIARTADDIDRALKGELHIVLSTEGAHYLGGELRFLNLAYNKGIRQIGLGHFVEGDILDVRTEPAKLGGLSEFGRTVIQRCNALGILIDLAHSNENSASQALQTSSQPMLWSHSNITASPFVFENTKPHKTMMSLGLDNAKILASKGGVIGIWPSRSDFDTPDAYIDGLQAATSMIGADHIAFGTDMQGLSTQATMMTDYSGMRDIVNRMLAKNMPEVVVRKVASENYGRLLKTVFNGRTAPDPM